MKIRLSIKDFTFLQTCKICNKPKNFMPHYNENKHVFQGALRQISVGFNSAWGVTADGRVLARIGIGDDSPTGREWSTVDADQMKHVNTIHRITLLYCPNNIIFIEV